MKKVFVTGVTGLLGTNLLNSLLGSGYHVIGFLRDKTRYVGIYHENLELIEGSLFDDIVHLLEDIDIVVHIAAETRHDLVDYDHYHMINRNATIQLFNCSVKCNVEKFIFISTANTMGFGSLNNLGNEASKSKEQYSSSFYAQSKLEAENYLLEHHDKMDVVILNPTFMLGAYDTKPSSGKIILMGWRKFFVFYPSGGKNFVHVKDVVYGIIRAFSHGENGERYLLANENMSYKEFYTRLNIITNQNPVMIQIPNLILKMMGKVGDLLRYMRIKTDLSSVNMGMLMTNNFYSNAKSIKELKVDYRLVDHSIKDAVNYFLSVNK